MITKRRACLLALFCLLWLSTGTAGVAEAHAEFAGSEPSNGAVMLDSPQRVSVRFAQPVRLQAGALKVFDARGQRVDKGYPRHRGGDERVVEVDLRTLQTGGYAASWRVTSEDSHPVYGAFTFQVGSTAEDATSLAQRLLSQQDGGNPLAIGYAFVRFAMVASLIVVVALPVFLMFVAAHAWQLRCIRMTWLTASAIAFVTSLLVIPLEQAFAAGDGLLAAFSLFRLSDVVDGRFGIAGVIRALTLLLMVAAAVSRLGPGSRWVSAGAFVTLVTLGAAGHAASGLWPGLGLVADVVHAGAASAWVGCLVLAGIAWRSFSKDSLVDSVASLSRVAFIAVVALTISGVLQGWRQLGDAEALFTTTYGQLLMAKVAVVGGMISSGWLARRHLHRLRSVRNAIRLEVAMSIVVFVLTSLLMTASPTTANEDSSFEKRVEGAGRTIDVAVYPAQAGQNNLHLYLFSGAGVPADVDGVSVTMSLPAREIAAVPVPFVHLAIGHWSAEGFTVPLSGTWQVELSVRVGEVVNTVELRMPIDR